jgi:UDP-N-acetylmuramyl pentapeptide phosphotransferase/UDP-N-acetylglucosamine-1-phosphate transferase
MTAAEVVPMTLGLCLLGAAGALPPVGVVFALALLGAMLGFAPFNRPVAKLFLGDVGSLPIGLLLGWLLVLVAGRGHLAAALLLPLYYLADATITLARRLIRREKVWQAHRTHFYQQAIDRGLTVQDVVARVFAANMALVALALAAVLLPGMPASLIAMALGTCVVTWLLVDFMRGKHQHIAGGSASHEP